MAKNKTRSNKTSSHSKPKTEAQKTTKVSDKQKDVLYQIRTKRDSGVLKAYITFTYRVFHPKVTARMVLYGLLILAPGFVVKTQALKIIL